MGFFTEGTASTGALESIPLHLSDRKPVLVTFSGNELSAFPCSWLFCARDEGSAWGGGRSLPVSLLLMSSSGWAARASPQAWASTLALVGYHRGLKLSFLQPHSHLAMQHHCLLLSLVFVSSLCGLGNQLPKKAAPHKLQPLLLAWGRETELPGVLCGTLSSAAVPIRRGWEAWENQKPPGESEGRTLIIIRHVSHTSGIHPHCFLLL